SISNRVLLLAALSAGTTRVRDLLDSDDTRVMLDALRALGCGVKHEGAALEVTGLGGRRPAPHARLFLGNAGTAMRPPTAALAQPYGEITRNLLRRFRRALARAGWQPFTRPAGARYASPGDIHVEADASSASYFVALGAIAAQGHPLRIVGVGEASIQGDIRF